MGSAAVKALTCGIALCTSVSSLADTSVEEDEIPDADFLEYLGIWEESDDEWLLLEEEEVAGIEERIDPVPKGEESTEIEDES